MADTGDRLTYADLMVVCTALAVKLQVVKTWISATKTVQIVHEIDRGFYEAACELEGLLEKK